MILFLSDSGIRLTVRLAPTLPSHLQPVVGTAAAPGGLGTGVWGGSTSVSGRYGDERASMLMSAQHPRSHRCSQLEGPLRCASGTLTCFKPDESGLRQHRANRRFARLPLVHTQTAPATHPESLGWGLDSH
jgi:hypothetical protein